MRSVTATQVKELAAGGMDIHAEDGTTILDRQTLLSMIDDDDVITDVSRVMAGITDHAAERVAHRVNTADYVPPSDLDSTGIEELSLEW